MHETLRQLKARLKRQDAEWLERRKWSLLRQAERALKRTRKPALRAILTKAIHEATTEHEQWAQAKRAGKYLTKRDHWDKGRKVLRSALRRVEGSIVHRQYIKMLWYARERRKLEDRTCPVCQKKFKPKRKDAVTCSNRCRQAQFRKKK
jgi:predicted amidophosphoribosyltransferase